MFRTLFALLSIILLTSCKIESGKSSLGKVDTNSSKSANTTTSTGTSATASTTTSGTNATSTTASTTTGGSTSVTTPQTEAPPQIPESLLYLGGN